MQIGFFFWPYQPQLVEQLAERADRYGYSMIGIADTPGNAMDPWIAAALAGRATSKAKVAICVTNLVTRQPAVSAAAIASLDLVTCGRAILGIGAGHSGTRNLGHGKSTAKELGEGVRLIRRLLRKERVPVGEGEAYLSWVERPTPVFLAASHPRALEATGREADGAFANYGLAAENIRDSEKRIRDAAIAAGRSSDEVEIWQIAALDCNEDGELARNKVGAMLAFLAGYVIGDKNLETRSVPEQYREPLLELRRRYSTRPGDADIKLVRELGLFEYLSRRLAICGTPADCLAQILDAKQAGAKKMMLTISLAADPVKTVELFGEHVMPHI
jgi:5,10-methylenetetrahydromethanopterin reductase